MKSTSNLTFSGLFVTCLVFAALATLVFAPVEYNALLLLTCASSAAGALLLNESIRLVSSRLLPVNTSAIFCNLSCSVRLRILLPLFLLSLSILSEEFWPLMLHLDIACCAYSISVVLRFGINRSPMCFAAPRLDGLLEEALMSRIDLREV